MASMGIFANFIQNTHPLNILLLRYSFTMIAFVAILLAQLVVTNAKAKQYLARNWNAVKQSPKLYLFTGLVSALVMATYVVGTLLFSVGLSVVLLYTATIYLPFTEKVMRRLFIPSLKHSKFGTRYYLSSAVNLVGLLLVVTSSLSDTKLNMVGLVSAVASGFLFSIMMVQIRAMRSSGFDAEHTLISGTMVGIVLFLPAAFLLPISFTSHNMVAATGLGAFATTIGGIFYFKGFSAVRADLAPLLAYFEPIFGSMLALIFLGERYSLLAVLGVVLIIGTNFAYTYYSRSRNQEAS
jgi:drug/metabolite transporter (DMT)-like permease